jgi:hypothetical protein
MRKRKINVDAVKKAGDRYIEMVRAEQERRAEQDRLHRPFPYQRPPFGTVGSWFFIHVVEDDRELIFQNRPKNLPVMRVELVETENGIMEEVRMPDYSAFAWPAPPHKPIRPRGADWVLFDDTHDKYTAWRRPRRTTGDRRD